MAEVFIETDRLLLRQWRDADREPFARMNADPIVMEFFVSTLTRQESDAFAARIADRIARDNYGLFAVERKDDGAFLGFTGFSSAPERTPVASEIEIGWRIAQQYWRRGYAVEAASACRDWFWEHMSAPRLVSFTSAANRPSRNLMRKLGLERRADLDFDYPGIDPDNGLRRQVVYALERADGAHG